MRPWLVGSIPILLASQAAFGSISGTVKDGDRGTPVAGAMVSLVDLERAEFTDSLGRYRLLDVPPGPQHVRVSRLGYASRTFHALVPRQGTLEIDVALRPEPIPLEQIEVGTTVAVRGLDGQGGPAFPDRGISLAALRNHPLSSEPDALEATRGGEVVVRPESPAGLHIRGGASDQVTYALDGIPVLSPYHAAGMFGAWNPDALSRVDVLGTQPVPDLPDALSGVVSGTTRAPGPQLQVQGGISTSQSRLTIDGPLGSTDGGYLASVRAGFPGLLGGPRDPSNVRGEDGDWLGKVVSPFLGGRLGLLSYGSTTEIEVAAAATDLAGPARERTRNELSWRSRSLGARWTRPLGRASLELRAWSVTADADARWRSPDSLPPEQLDAGRRDEGLVAMVELARSGRSTTAGLRAESSRTFYRLTPDSASGALDLDGRTPVSSAFVRHRRPLTSRGEVELSLATTLAAQEIRLDPGARLEWKPAEALTVSCGCSRRHQYAQSLRNPESVVGNIFPADLTVGAGTSRVPVARTDLGIVALEHRPTAGLRLGAQAYARSFRSLALVAPSNAGPFASTTFTKGSGEAYGLAFQLGMNGARYGVVADYGLQRLRLAYADSSYVPDHGATHSIDAGVIVFPSPTFSVRVGMTSIFGRRTTAVLGGFEWEACNLLDQGCEFAGSPSLSGSLGGARLPDYHRMDLGIRKHWHVRLLGRDAQVAAFGAATNLLGRRNALTVAVDPATGQQRLIEMRPRSPLVLGVDWRF